MHWKDFAAEQPRFAEQGRRLLGDPGVVLVGTIRLDGTPRVSPVEPLFWQADLWLSMLWGSRKAEDLARDPRVLVHNTVSERDGRAGEYKVRGRAVRDSDLDVQQEFADEVRRQLGWSPEPEKFHLYRVDVDDVTYVRYDDVTGDQFTTRWPQCAEFVRRGTSATTVASPEPYSELLRDDDIGDHSNPHD